MLKTYIKTNFANGFIWRLKSPTSVLILFIRKPNSSFHLYIDYWGLINLTIKKQYLLPFISKYLDRFRQRKRFTQLDLTSAYYQIRTKENDE